MQMHEVRDPSQVGEMRRQANACAKQIGMSEREAGAVALVATELASNLLKHAGGGEMLLGRYAHGAEGGVELIALDKGPGIADPARSLTDGVSTAGTAGEGLGACARQATLFELHSAPGRGTAVLARLCRGEPDRRPGRAVGVVRLPKPGETVCGDDLAVRSTGDGVLELMVADGLGHGPFAATASLEAVRLFDKAAGGRPVDQLERLHAGLRATRGAAVAVARIEPRAGSTAYAGVGNIAGVLVVDGQSRRMVSMNGTVGHAARKISGFDYPFTPGAEALVVMHSDGLGSSWSLDAYPGLAARHPALIAAVLYRDFNRGRDDVTVLAARTGPA